DKQATQPVTPLDYHEQPQSGGAHKRIVEHTVTLFMKDDLSGPLDVGTPSRLGLLYENYKLALTNSLLNVVFANDATQDNFAAEARSALGQAAARAGFLVSGYQKGSEVLGTGGSSQWWMRSGVAGFAPDAARHFYLAERYIDPFGYETTLTYDSDDLFVEST